MITKDDSKNAIWLAYCDLRADYEQLSKERDQLKDRVNHLHYEIVRVQTECVKLEDKLRQKAQEAE